MGKLILPRVIIVLLTAAIVPARLSAQAGEWKTLSNRAGWSIQYPSDWFVSSCHACEDLTDPSIEMVNFHPPRYNGGMVKLEILARTTDGISVDELFDRIKAPNSRDAYLLEEERMSLGGLPVLRAVYSGPAKMQGKGLQHEITFIVGRHNVFSVAFFSPLKIRIDDPIIPIRQVKNYEVYQKLARLLKESE